MSELSLVIGNKNYSSWSLRAWLVLEQTKMSFEEILVPLDQPESKQQIMSHSEAGRVPILHHGDLTIWDTYAISEYLAELCPDRGLWPADRSARAIARAVVSEIHSGFEALREELPMDVRATMPQPELSISARQDIARVCAIWEQLRHRNKDAGPYLFGAFTIADAFFAPVVSRFQTYGVDMPEAAASYQAAVWECPAMQSWRAESEKEPWTIDLFGTGD